MNPYTLFELCKHEFEQEGIVLPEWDRLSPSEQIAWGRICRRLQSQHGLNWTLALAVGAIARQEDFSDD